MHNGRAIIFKETKAHPLFTLPGIFISLFITEVNRYHSRHLADVFG